MQRREVLVIKDSDMMVKRQSSDTVTRVNKKKNKEQNGMWWDDVWA